MFEVILYPTDFSDASKQALAYCRQLKEAGTKKIVVLHVIEADGYMKNLPPKFRDELLDLLKKDAVKEMGLIEALLKESGFDIETKIEFGNAIQEILKAEEAQKISAIVLGSHGKSNVREMILGSVSENIVRKSKSPVLVIKRKK